AFSEKRWTHTCRTKKALAVNEGSLGGATESCGTQVVDQYNRNPQLTDSLRFQIGCGVKLLARGLEPPRVSPYGPEPYASANSATRAKGSGRYNAHARVSCKVKPTMLILWQEGERSVVKLT